MRPVGSGADGLPSHPRKPSFVAPSPINLQSHVPTSFFLARESDLDSRSESSKQEEPTAPAVYSLEEAISGAETRHQEESYRRRSTLRPTGGSVPRDLSVHATASPAVPEPLTPLLAASPGDVSLQSSPKSVSSRSLRSAEIGSISDEISSQAIVSSGEDEEEHPEIQDSAPQLIMPSIKMPSRRPFTKRGRELGRIKIMVAGSKGSGKTTLIKSIVQTCEDIVHVDPVGSTSTTPAASTLVDRRMSALETAVEIYASTKPYPAWWSELDESKILRRRKSLGDSILERNVCFVDTNTGKSTQHLIRYMEQQLQAVINATSAAGTDFVNLLSGGGGVQVDVILFLVSKDTLYRDIDIIKELSELSNVIPLIAKSDLLAPEEITRIKSEVVSGIDLGPTRPFRFPRSFMDAPDGQPPFAVSAALSPDTETMDASLLMSSEYVQPLVPSDLTRVVRDVFDRDIIPYLRHSAAKKMVNWRSRHSMIVEGASPIPSASPRPSTLGSPLLTSASTSGVLVPQTYDLSLTTSNSYTLARIADHTQHEERLAQVRLAKWATDLQQSLARERERYERLARGERATWLVERLSQEVRDGRVQAIEKPFAKFRSGSNDLGIPSYARLAFETNDPLGLLKWNDGLKTKGWIALQVFGSFGVIGGLALWLARTWGFTSGQSVADHGSGYHWKW